jgi:signal transduction histidine kinase
LAEASARLSSTLDYNETLRNVAELLVNRVCSMASVLLIDADRISVVAWHHGVAAKRDLISKMDTAVTEPGVRDLLLKVVATGQSVVIERLDHESFRKLKVSDKRMEDYRAAGITSFVLAPMTTHGHTIGVLSCVCTEPDAPLDINDVPLIEEIAKRAATAVDHARLFDKTRRSEEVQRFLNEASVKLAASLDYETTFRNVASVLVPQMAEWVAIHVLEGGKPKRVAVAHSDPAKARWATEMSERYPTDMESGSGLGFVLRTGNTEFYPHISEEMLVAEARDPEHASVIKQLRVGSVMIVPMSVRNEVIGAITFVASEQGRYTQIDLDFAIELAHRAASAVDHARLFRNVEEMVESRTRELQAVNKELEAFAYSVSHDLRAPLRSIMSASMIVMEDYGEAIGEEGRAELKRASAAAKRMSTLIDDLLEFSRLGRREMALSDVDLSALANTIGTEISLPEGVLEVEPNLTATADSALLRVAMTNYLENAWKFSKEHAKPRIRVGQVMVDGEPAFYVQDNGVGFDEQYAEKLFVPFERLHSPHDYPGTGIGLANVKRIVARHDGKVWAHSKPGEGATFFFTLPR